MSLDPVRNAIAPDSSGGVAGSMLHSVPAAEAMPVRPPRPEPGNGSLGAAHVLRSPVRNAESWTAAAPVPRPVAPATPWDDAEDVHDVLTQRQFLKQLQREKRRAERSKAPLSIALIQFPAGKEDALESRIRFLEANKRETDVVGLLGEDLLGVLLPDTNAAGNRMFLRKLESRADAASFSAVAATYPDHIFDSLTAADPGPAQHHPMFLEQATRPTLYDVVKRWVDIVGAGIALLLLAPVMLVTAILVAVTTPGPVIYKQVRLGRRGVPFAFYKFRSMHCNADSTIHREHVTTIIKGSEANGDASASAAWQKLHSDPRITTIGKIIRRASIDELPQLWSVLKGDMSLVGPRPPLKYEAEAYQPWHLRRILEVKPGITGLWQVGGRGRVSFDEMVRMDLRYIRERSVMLDVRILLQTVAVVVRREGAG